MARHLVKTSIYLDSRDKSSGDINDYKTYLPRPLRIAKWQVKSVEIPFSYYVINSSNNTITWEDSVPNTHSATITPGNYTGSQLASEIQTKMNAQMSGFTVTFSSNTYKLSWSNASTFKLLASGNTTADEIIGLSGDGTLATSDASDNAINLSGPHYVMIRSNELSKGRPLSINSTKSTSYIHRTRIEEGVGDIITDKGDTSVFELETPIVIRNLDIGLYDENDALLDLNGLHWSLQVDVWELT